MIENNRDEEVCRRWDALSDEDHTHHLTVQEYFHNKNKWWLHSNKQGSETMPLRHRSDFKQAYCLPQNVYTKKMEENNSHPLLTGITNNGSWHRVRLLLGENRKTPGGLKIQKAKDEASKVLGKNGDTRC